LEIILEHMFLVKLEMEAADICRLLLNCCTNTPIPVSIWTGTVLAVYDLICGESRACAL